LRTFRALSNLNRKQQWIGLTSTGGASVPVSRDIQDLQRPPARQ